MAVFRNGAALPLAYVVMGIIWPWSMAPSTRSARSKHSHFWRTPGRKMHEHAVFPNMPRHAEVLCPRNLPGSLAGAVFSVRGEVDPKRASLMLLVTAAVLPIAPPSPPVMTMAAFVISCSSRRRSRSRRNAAAYIYRAWIPLASPRWPPPGRVRASIA
jgi:hypothetical protein